MEKCSTKKGRKKLVLLVLIGLMFVSSCAYAGIFNKSEDVIGLVNNLETKAGYIWYPQDKEYDPMVSASLYTFTSKDETNQFRIGSIDLGYSKAADKLSIGNEDGQNTIFLAAMIDARILETFSIPVPHIGNFELMGGLAIGVDADKIGDIKFNDSQKAFKWGIPTVGLKLNF